MRPRSLQLKGFTVFRDMLEALSFEGAELFALTGPTGSGKTSLLDAMSFALYGRVARLDARAVEPVISLGSQEARIHFEFSVGDDVYTAARVVRRTRTGGASTAEARLEVHASDGTRVPVASGKDEVDEQVAKLIGLDFDQFSKTVLLPQGQFATFLHDTPAKRQDLLRTLLELGLYERMRELAQHRKSRAEGEAGVLARDVDRLAEATEAAEKAAAQKVDALRHTLKGVRAHKPELDRIAQAVATAKATRGEVEQLVDRLATVEVPPSVKAMAAERTQVTKRLSAAREVATSAGDRVVDHEKRISAMPDVAELSAVAAEWQRHSDLEQRRAKGVETTEAARERLAAATKGEGRAKHNDEVARAALRAIENRHAGAALAGHLVVGEDCPVCLRPVSELPDHPVLSGLDDATKQFEVAASALQSAQREVASASTHLDTCVDTLARVDQELSDLHAKLEGRPTLSEAAGALASIKAANTELMSLRESERAAVAAVESIGRELQQISAREVQARRDLSAVRDALAPADPPELDLTDLDADWRRLMTWSVERGATLRGEIERHTAALESLESARSDHVAAVSRLVEPHGIDPADPEPVERLVALLSAAELELAAIVADRETAAAKTKALAAATTEAEVAGSMALHLQASRFEGWLMEEALVGLVAGANALLGQLSSGAYSLDMSKRDFSVIDHRNADETRSVKTLSGGETFLVSLALALSLAEQIGGMAVGGTARLESIFLDEGFGTLDADTLDVVASVIQELGASGRTVGIVTHVTELADLVPTRFEVVRGPAGSTVTRIDT